MDFWQRYRAIDARDTRFDGQFYTAVRSTGIYCRPSCPARTPKAENVTFYETSAAANDAGYRACKRCLPEAVPGTPAWNRTTADAAQVRVNHSTRVGELRLGDVVIFEVVLMPVATSGGGNTIYVRRPKKGQRKTVTIRRGGL